MSLLASAVDRPRTTTTGVPVRGHRPVRPTAFLVVFCLGLFMTLLDVTIVNIAVPDLVTELSTGLETVLWVLSAYSLVYTVLLISSGRLGDIVGPRQMYLAGLAIFTAASLASGVSTTPGQLILFRALQGFGAALLAPQGLAMITALFPPAKRGPAFAATGIVSGLGVLLGPTLGGLIVTQLDWRWIFYLNVPLGVAALVLAVLWMPDIRPGTRHRLDVLGVVLLSFGLLGVVFALVEGDRYDWGRVVGPVTVWHVLAAGIAVLGVFAWQQHRRQDSEPLLPFSVFRDRTYMVCTLVLGGMGFAMVGVFLPLTIFYQSVLGLSALAAGLVLGTQSLAMMITSGVVGSLTERLNLKVTLMAGLLLFAAGVTFVVLVAHPGADRWTFVPGLVVAGIGLGCVWTPLYGMATRDLPPQRAGVAAGVLDTVQELGSVLATAVLGAVLTSRLTAAVTEQAHLAAAGLPAEVRVPFVTAMGHAGQLIGAGQAGGLDLGSDLPPAVAAQVQVAAEHVFAVGFTEAMRPTVLVPAVVLALAALAVTLIPRRATR